MFRTLCLIAALLVAGASQAQQPAPPPGMSEDSGDRAAQAARLWQVMDMDALMPILRQEALIEARAMQDEMFQNGGAGGWLDKVARIHDPARLEALFKDGIRRKLPATPGPRLDAALDFYRTGLGQRLIGLETGARQAMLDPETEAQARERFSAAASRADPRVRDIARLIETADLLGPNVAGGMNAAIAFSRGFADAGGFDMNMSEEQMLADAWAQEPAIRAETLGWLEAYLMLAYSPLNDAELQIYIGFAGSDEGRALSALLFAGFDALFLQTSRDLGVAAAAQMQGRAL